MDPLVSHSTRQGRDSLSRLVGSLSINDDNNDNNPSSSTTVSAEEVILSKSREGSLNDSDPSTTPTCSRSSTSTSTFVLFQPDCVKHRYVRNHHDLSEIVERPQRIKAIKAGVAAAYSKSENQQLRRERWSPPDEEEEDEDEDELGNLMKSLSIESNTKKKKKKKKEIKGETSPFDILVSHDTLSLDSPALNMIHGVPNYPPDYIPPPPSSRRSSPRKSTPSSTTPYPSTSPWPTQLLHLVHQTAAVTTTTTTTGSRRESEIPSHLPQGDLYLCRESDQAIFGALGAVCKGVDLVVAGVDRNTTTRRKDKGKEKEKETTEYENGFVVIRPPGHHCGEANPQGFCFVNNVAVAAAHAHLEHGINRVVILDIDLHHGNGTQEIVWQLNEKAHEILTSRRHRQEEEEEVKKVSRSSPRKSSSSPFKLGSTTTTTSETGVIVEEEEEEESEPRPLQIMYSSLHDVLSFPCESGDPGLIASASLNISGPHSQFIQNTHVQTWSNLKDFETRLWPLYWNKLGGGGGGGSQVEGKGEGGIGIDGKIEEFLIKTFAKPKETLFIVSAGFDASLHEYSTMSRHDLNVPTSFYSNFSESIQGLAKRFGGGKLLFVLEGGYSDKALVSGSMGVLEGLLRGRNGVDAEEGARGEDGQENLEELERIVQVCGLGMKPTNGKQKKGNVKDGSVLKDDDQEWIKRTKEIFNFIKDDDDDEPIRSNSNNKLKSSMTSTTTTTTTIQESIGGTRQLRERKIRLDYAGLADMSVPLASRQPPALQATSTAESTTTSSDQPSTLDHSTTTIPHLSQSTLPRLSSSSVPSGTAFSSVPPSSFYSAPTGTAEGSEGLGVESKPKPAIKFVWKQGGIGGTSSTTTTLSSDSNGKDFDAPRM